MVEDSGLVALEIRETLEGLGYQVVGEAKTGKQAVELAGRTQPDIVLMDIILQGDMDGIEAADRIYSLYNTPVIYLTSHSDDSTLKRALKTNAFGYILKPFNDRELYSNIEMTLHKHRVMKNVEPEEVVDSTLNFVSDAIISIDNDGSVTRINPAAEALTGWSREETIGRDFFSVFDLERDKIEEVMISLRKESGDKKSLLSWIDGLKFLSKSGKKTDVALNIGFVPGSKWRDDEYFILLVPGDSIINLSSRESKLEKYYRLVTDAIHEPVFLIDSSMKIIIYNKAFGAFSGLMGVSQRDFDKPVYDVLPNSVFGGKYDLIESFRTGSTFVRERTLNTGEGNRYLTIESIPISDSTGVTHIAVIVTDYTFRTDMENRTRILSENVEEYSRNMEEIADLCTKIKEPLSHIRRISELNKSFYSRDVLKSCNEIGDILFDIDMMWLKYENIKKFFEYKTESLIHNESEKRIDRLKET